ncbi:MAG: NHL repeat-containing protein [Actinobacteria bacterium]|nr:NHL repeat-containing protein [Actinomycetota bacterium]
MSNFDAASELGGLGSDLRDFDGSIVARGHKPGAPPAPGIGGRHIVDRFNGWFGSHLQQISPLLGGPFNSGTYLRSLLGNLYLLLPALAVILAVLSLFDTRGLAVPPTFGLCVAMMALGVIDAFSGLVGFVVFAIGVILSGHFFSTHLVTGSTGSQGMLYALTGLFGVALLWFIAPQLAEKIRPIVVIENEVGLRRFYIVAADFVVLPFLTILILGSLPALMPSLTGASQQGLAGVTVQEHMPAIKIIIAVAMIVRVATELFLHRQFAPIATVPPLSRPPLVDRTLKAFTSLFAFALIWEVMGWMWQTPVVWVAYLLTEKFGALGERFLRPSSLLKFIPRNLFKIFVTLIFAQYAMKILNGKFVSGSDILGWLAIALAGITAVFGSLEGAKRAVVATEVETGTWWSRASGFVVVLLLIVVSQDFVHIEAKSYSSPQGVSVSALNTTYIADAGNNRVVRVGLDGSRSTVGTDLRHPYSAVADPSTSKEVVFIADAGHNRVLRVDIRPSQSMVPSYRYQMRAYAARLTAQRTIGHGFKTPTGIAVDRQGRVFVADSGHGLIVTIDKQGNQEVFTSGLQKPQAICIDPFGNVWITDTGRGIVYKFAATDDGTAGTRTTYKSGLDNPSGVAVDAANNVFISNTGRDEVLQFRANGDSVRVEGAFSHPTALAVNSSGHAYVANQITSDISVITPLYLRKNYNTAPSSNATSVALLKNGDAIVVSQRKGTVERLSSSKRTTLCSGLDHPYGLVVTSLDEIYVTEPNSGTIYQILKNGDKKILMTGLDGITALASDGYGGMLGVQPKFGNLLTISRQGVSALWVGGLQNPTGVAKDAFGFVNVTLGGTGHKDGSVIRIVSGQQSMVIQSGLDDPAGIASDSLGNIFYVESGAHRVWEYMNALGGQIVAQGSEDRGKPIAIVADSKGDVYVLEHSPNHLVRYILTAHSASM